ncbi:glycoside hydrolase family protein [Chryseobacterium sp. 2R14A]|uniref:glycoside hydrolase family protein n=1 Tax=Chryseobacterium sp. 2R14A TaxID=3380353 RepID=UPI003CE76E22
MSTPKNFTRKEFLQTSALGMMTVVLGSSFTTLLDFAEKPYFKLKPIGRSLELDDYYIWCSSPIWGEDGKVHLFYSRWKKEKGMGGWLNGSEICRAEANSAFDKFEHKEIILAPRAEGFWDATTCHNPLIKKVEDQYFLFFMGNSNGKTNTKRIGLAVSKNLEGPWNRPDKPLLLPGKEGSWDDHCTTNPAFVKGNDGKYWLFYKSWNTKEYETQKGAVRGNRKYGLAKALKPEGPYLKVSENPVIDFSSMPNNAQLEDAFVWKQNGKFHMIARDMGFFNHEYGLHLTTKDGIKWTKPEVAYLDLKQYVTEPEPPKHLKRFGRLERPMILFDKDGKTPKYLFGATQGGTFGTSTTFVFEILKR